MLKITTAFSRADGFSSRMPAHWIGTVALFSLAMVFIVLGHDGRRVAQLATLLLPLLILQRWPLQSPRAQRLRSMLAWAWVMLFVLDGIARSYLSDAYQAAPDGTLVLSAIANTNPRESGEYLLMNWRSMVLWCGAALISAWMAWQLAKRNAQPVGGFSRKETLVLAALLILVTTAYASKPWRRLHPAVFWPQWTESIDDLRDSWAEQQNMREQTLASARALAPVITRTGPSTVMLVLGESVNRDNLSIYGYGRETTPQLRSLLQSNGAHLLPIRNAWSTHASTQPSLQSMFHIPSGDEKHPQHLLALARSAGYKIWWISNHDDVAIKQQHAQFADVMYLVNKIPGRASTSLDGELLDEVDSALADPNERKLIVVHLLGAHPHYRLRFPEGRNPFDDVDDTVEHQLAAQGRPAWLRTFRNEYDAALLYHDSVIAALLRMLQKSDPAQPSPNGYRSWMYLSDHGQEVGHSSNHAGHSASTASGYRIPALLWHNENWPANRDEIPARPFRADWLAWTLADMMHLRWQGQMPQRSLLAKDYRWEAPKLPIQLRSFVD